MFSIKPFYRLAAFAVTVCLVGAATSTGNEVDVYFIVGQSNAINFAKEAGVGSTAVDLSLIHI